MFVEVKRCGQNRREEFSSRQTNQRWNVSMARRRFNNPACLLIKPVRARVPSVWRARTTRLWVSSRKICARSLISNKRETILSHRSDRIISKRTDSLLRRTYWRISKKFLPKFDESQARNQTDKPAEVFWKEISASFSHYIINFRKSLNIPRLRRNYSVSMLTGIKSNLFSEYIRRIYTDVRRFGHISVRRREHLAFVAWKISRMRGGLKSRRRMSATRVDSIRGVGGKRGRATAQVHEGWWHVGLDIVEKKKKRKKKKRKVYRQSNLMPLKTTPSSKISRFITFL